MIQADITQAAVDSKMPPFDQNTNQPSNFGSGDFSGQLNDMLAPYQQMAQKMQSPYATMSPNSWLARNHPQAAGMLDNAFLTMGSIPSPQGPEGVGGGISRMMQGLMGAQQYRRQQMMQNMMMPYQMMMPQLQAQDMMGQIEERKFRAPLEMAQAERANAQSSMYLDLERHRQETERQGQERIEGTINPAMLMHRRALIQAGLPPDADINKATPEQTERYGQALDTIQKKNQPAGSFEEHIGNLLGFPQGSPERAEGERLKTFHLQNIGAGAGARTQAEQNITQPPKDIKDFISQEDKTVYRDIPALDSFDKFKEASGIAGKMSDIDPIAKNQLQSDYNKRKAEFNAAMTKRDTERAQWKRSSAPSQGIGFFEWLANPKPYDNAAPSQLPPEAANAPREVDKNWHY